VIDYREAFDRAGVAMLVVDTGGRLVRANTAFAELVGRDAESLAGRDISELVPPGDQREEWVRATAAPGAFHADRRFVRADGDVRWVRLTGTLFADERGRITHAFAVAEDVTARRRAERDALTGLPGGAALEAAAGRQAAAARRYGAEGAVILLDLDGFTALNARLGLDAGDRLLRTVAEALRSRVRATDLLVRVAADEFGLLVPRGSLEEALVVARDLHLTVCASALGATCSVGVAAFGDPDDGAGALARARTALDDVRRAGGSGVAAAIATI
jgi:diguanylate cyclase (GGDEF)-like protein/PAS domain S-box-containing protein